MALIIPRGTAKLPFGVTQLVFQRCKGIMRHLYPPKIAPLLQLRGAASVQRHKPLRLVSVPLSGECNSSLDVGVLHRISPGPSKARLSVGTPGPAASLARQHSRLPVTTGSICCSPSRCCIPVCLAPCQNLPQKSLFFTGTGQKKKRAQKAQAPTGTYHHTGVLF